MIGNIYGSVDCIAGECRNTYPDEVKNTREEMQAVFFIAERMRESPLFERLFMLALRTLNATRQD